MEIHSRGSSVNRSTGGIENASLIENQEPVDVAAAPTVEAREAATGESSVGATSEVAAGVAAPPPDTPPPVYYPQGDLPPPYHVAATLPTYEEAELIKAGKLDQSQIHREVIPGHILGEEAPSDGLRISGGLANVVGGLSGGRRGEGAPLRFATALTFPSLHPEDPEGGGHPTDAATAAAQLLGNDFVFFTAFLTAFLFNWIGFLLLMCFCHTIAARYGALAGFGLSLAKWTLIVKNSTDFASNENSWLWWLITAFGMLVCMRAVFQYLHIKRSWRHLSSAARERLFFFY